MDEGRLPRSLHPGALAAIMAAAVLLAALAPALFPFRPFTRAYYDPWAGVGAIVAVTIALLTAGQERRIVLAGATVSFLAGTGMAAAGLLDFNLFRSALALFAVGGVWLGGATRRAWTAVVPALLGLGVLGLALAWRQMEAIHGYSAMLGMGAALALLTAGWAPYLEGHPSRRMPTAILVVVAATTLAAFLLLKEYWVPAENGLSEQTILYNALTAAIVGFIIALGTQWPAWRALRVLLGAAALVLVPSMLGGDPEAAFLLPFFLVGGLLSVAAAWGLGAGGRIVVERLRGPQDD